MLLASFDKKKLLLTLLLILSAVLALLVGWYIGRPLVAFASSPEQFRAWVGERGIWAPVCMVAMVVFQVIFALIPGEPFELAAGYAFGSLYGCVLCLLGTAIGGSIVFLLVHRWGRAVLELYFPAEKIDSLRFLQDTPRTRSMAFLVMMVPGTPKDLLSYGMGLTKLRLGEWFFISLVARVPSVLTSTVCGSALGEKNYQLAAVVFGLTVLVGLGGLWLYGKLSANPSDA